MSTVGTRLAGAGIQPLLDEIERIHRSKGWFAAGWDVHRTFAHLHSEVSEAWTTVRKGLEAPTVVDGKPEGLGAELADVLILAAAIAVHREVDLARALTDKLDHCHAKWDLMAEGA